MLSELTTTRSTPELTGANKNKMISKLHIKEG